MAHIHNTHTHTSANDEIIVTETHLRLLALIDHCLHVSHVALDGGELLRDGGVGIAVVRDEVRRDLVLDEQIQQILCKMVTF